MMLKYLMRNGITVAVAIGAMSLVGCGQGGGSNNGGGGGASATNGSVGGDGHDNGQAAVDHGVAVEPPSGGGAGDAQAVVAAFDDSSADAAIATYINRLKAGDLVGAAEICVSEAPGTEALVKIGTKINEMEADPEDSSLAKTTRALYVSDLKTMEAVKTVEEDGVVVYEVSVINKAPVNIRVELRDGAWRVIPPIGGTPMG